MELNKHQIPEIKPDSWLGEILQKPVCRVDLSSKVIQEPGYLGKALKAQGPLFAYAKVSVDQIRVIEALTREGFCLIDTNVTFEGNPQLQTPKTNSKILVRHAEKKDEARVGEIAGTAFEFSFRS